MKTIATFLFLLGLTAAAQGQPAADARALLDTGRQAYAAGRYAEAGKDFEAAAGHGVLSIALCLDAATAWRLAGEPGRAALWLYRAARQQPGDATVQNALAAAGLRPPRTGLFLGNVLAPRLLWYVVLGANALFWLSLGLARILGRRLPRAGLLVAATIVVGLWCEVGWLELTPILVPEGVVLADTPARSAPEPTAEPLFSLPPGEIVGLGLTRQGYRRVDAGGDRLGWISSETVTALVP